MPSYTKAAILILFVSYRLAIAVPIPDNMNQVNNAYSGTAGDASGGSVHNNVNTGSSNTNGGPLSIFNGGSLIRVFSGNAGKGGHASSGMASASPASNLQVGGNNTDTKADGTTSSTTNTVGNAYTGAGGIAKGGDVDSPIGGLIEVFSGNAGSGGDASSGSVNRPVLLSKKPMGVGRTRVSRVIRVRLD